MTDRDPDDRRDDDEWGDRADRPDDDWGDRGDRADGDENWPYDPSSNGGRPDPTGGAPSAGAGIRSTVLGVLTMSLVSVGLVALGFVIGGVGLLVVGLALAAGFGIDLVENVTLQLVIGTVLLQGVGFGTAALAYLRYKDLGFEYVRATVPSLSDVAWAIAAFVGGYVLLIVGSLLLTVLGISGEDHSLAEMASGNPEILLVLIPLSFLLIGPGEELLFRGVIQNAFVDRVGVVGGIVASSAIFALIHLPNYGWLDGLPTLAVLFVVTLVWGSVYERTDSLFVPAMAHGAFNALQFAILYVTLKYGPELNAALVW